MLNPVAERLTGWTQSDAVGRSVDEVFRIASEDDQTPVESPVRRVLREGVVVGLANHTVLLTRDGRQIPIADSGAPIRAAGGEMEGVVLVFRDQTEERLAQQALRDREQYLSRLFENMSDGFALHDILLDDAGSPVDYRFLEINRAFTVMTGIDDSAVGKTAREVLPGIELDPGDWIRRYGRVATTGQSERFEAYAETLRRWYSVTAYCPEPGRFATVFQDISRRKQTELELENQRALLKFRAQMLDNVGEAVVVTDPEGTVLFWNRAATRLYGWTADEAVFAPLDRLAGIHETSAASLAILRRDDEGSGWSGESRMPRRDGTTFPALITTTPVRDDAGELTAVIGVSRDISERKSAELRYAGLFDSIWDAIVLATIDGEITDTNEGFSQLFGYERDEILGRRTVDLCADTDSFQGFSAAVQAADRGPGAREVVEYRKRTGESFRGETVVYNLIDDDVTSGYVAIIRDVSEREAMESKLIEAQKIEALGQIAGGIAHDFNNVLTAISTATRFLADRVPDESARRYLGVIRSSVQRGNGVTSRMLTFARSTAPEARSIALASFLADFQELAKHSLPSNVHVGVGAVTDDQCVRVDPTQLQQVLLTLAINAADAMPNGGEIVIAVRPPTPEECGSSATPEEYWCVDIIDHGVGMDQETKARIFEPFFTTRATAGGTGLGLAVARKIVQLHGGWISVESEPGRGTIVTVALPAAPAAEVVHGVDEPIVPGRGERLLIVDDEDAVREMLVEVLADNEYAVVAAANATEALGILGDESNRFDLVVTDIGLPDINGRELIGRIRADRASLPIVAVTGYVDPSLIESLTDVGASAVVRKPYDVGELTKTIRTILNRDPG